MMHTQHSMMRKHQMIRQQLRTHQQNNMQSRVMMENPGMYGTPMPAATPPAAAAYNPLGTAPCEDAYLTLNLQALVNKVSLCFSSPRLCLW